MKTELLKFSYVEMYTTNMIMFQSETIISDILISLNIDRCAPFRKRHTIN